MFQWADRWITEVRTGPDIDGRRRHASSRDVLAVTTRSDDPRVMDSFDPTRKPHATGPEVCFRVRAPTRGVEAEVRLRNAGGRWISVSEAIGREVTGIGPTARDAVVASLSWLGPRAMSELLADVGLLDVSHQLLQLKVVG